MTKSERASIECTICGVSYKSEVSFIDHLKQLDKACVRDWRSYIVQPEQTEQLFQEHHDESSAERAMEGK